MSTQLSTRKERPIGDGYRICRDGSCARSLWFEPHANTALFEMNEATLLPQGVSV